MPVPKGLPTVRSIVGGLSADDLYRQANQLIQRCDSAAEELQEHVSVTMRTAKVAEQRELLASEQRAVNECRSELAELKEVRRELLAMTREPRNVSMTDDEMAAERAASEQRAYGDRPRLEARDYGSTNPRAEEGDGFGVRYTAGSGLNRDAGWGRALRSDESFAQLVRGTERETTGQTPPELSLRKYLRGMVTGDWDDAAAERRAMAEGVLGTGGYMLPAVLSGQIIDLARNQTRVMQAGARLVPMPNKTLDVPRWLSDPTAQWHAENALIPATDASLDRIRLDAKALTSRVVASRELLEDAPGIENELRSAFAAQFAQTVDTAALYGSGIDPEPRGVKNTSGITNLAPFGVDGGKPTDWDWLIDGIGALQDANQDASGIIWAGRTERTMGKLKASDGQPLNMPTSVAAVPRYSTKQVPTNLTAGASSDTSDVFIGDWSQLYIGVRTGLQIQVLTERYADTGQIGFLAWWRGDIAVAQPQAFAVAKGLRA